jgi:hypothetical protein
MAAVVNLATSTVQVRQPWWPFVTWGLVGLLVVTAVRVEVGTRRSQAAEAGELDRVLSWLVVQVRQQWEHDAVLRHLYDPLPLRVRWCSTRRPVAADRVLVLDDPAGTDWESLPLCGHAEEIVQAFLKLPHERLVVLGEPGAGKSVLAALLTLGLLRLREALEPEKRKRTPLPVLVPISSWDPQAEHLQTFLARRLGEDYPSLSLPGDGEPSVAAALIAGRHLLPILDGLDELSTELHPQAASELNAYAGVNRGLVVTCRSHEYEQAVKKAGKELARAAVVELQAVLVEQAIEFLSQPALARPRWQPVFDHLRGHPDGALATVLSTPLTTALARAAYSSPTTDPRDLLAFRDSYATEAALMDGFVGSAYPSDRPDSPLGRPLRRYAPDRASRWLGCLAHQCCPDWRWWDIHDNLMVRPQRVELMIITGAIVVVAGVGVIAGLPIAIAIAIQAVTNVSGLWRPLWPRGYPPYYFPTSDRLLRLRRLAFAAIGATVTRTGAVRAAVRNDAWPNHWRRGSRGADPARTSTRERHLNLPGLARQSAGAGHRPAGKSTSHLARQSSHGGGRRFASYNPGGAQRDPGRRYCPRNAQCSSGCARHGDRVRHQCWPRRWVADLDSVSAGSYVACRPWFPPLAAVALPRRRAPARVAIQPELPWLGD